MNMIHSLLSQFLEKSAQEWQRMKPGLERIQAACEALGNPEKKIRIIHIAGTNGKGSVAAMLQSILSEAGLKVGLFTSPHLLRVNERFRIGNEEISDGELEKYLNQIVGAMHLQLSFFEFCTLMAFLYFAEQKVDVAILETGLGGRLDATNVGIPLISVITEIGLDHTEILGTDITSIAREKAGIIKTGIPVVCGASHPEARRVIEEVASSVGANLVFAQGDHKDRPYNFTYKLNLVGFHQIQNAKIVLKTIEVLNSLRIFSNISEEAVEAGFANVRWPGRMEWVSRDPPILLDGAHNVDGMRALVESLKILESPKKWRILFSAVSDKQVNEMISCLQEIASEIVICKMKNLRSIDPEKILAPVGAIHELPLRVANDSAQAFHQIKKSLRVDEGILITGSLYFIGELKGVLNEANPTNG